MNRNSWIILVAALLIALSCKKDDSENPYNLLPVVQNDNPEADELPESNFAWIQAKVFKPTCAASGCHDGTFEPEFNNIASSYASLVNHTVITNDEDGSFEYRVVPNDSHSSLLIERLTVFIPNTSGIMPLEVEGDSDWIDGSDDFIQKIKDWIDAGAKDMYGNNPPSPNADFPPQIDGFVVFPLGNTTDPFIRDPDEIGISPILVDATSIDMWIRVSDDNTSVSTMNNNTVKISTDITSFDTATEYNYSVESAITALDFADSPADFYHKVTIDLSGASSGDTYFVRNYLDDFEQLSLTELPNDGSNAVITALFIIKVQ